MFDRFFRNRAINAFLKNKKICKMPYVLKCPTVALLINEGQLTKLEELDAALKKLFGEKKYSFYVISNELKDFVAIGHNIKFITRKEYNLIGMINLEAQSSLSSDNYDMIVNLSGSGNDLLTEEYLMTLLNSSFRISFGKSYDILYDLVIDSKEDDLIGKIVILHKYLLMLSGK